MRAGSALPLDEGMGSSPEGSESVRVLSAMMDREAWEIGRGPEGE